METRKSKRTVRWKRPTDWVNSELLETVPCGQVTTSFEFPTDWVNSELLETCLPTRIWQPGFNPPPIGLIRNYWKQQTLQSQRLRLPPPIGLIRNYWKQLLLDLVQGLVLFSPPIGLIRNYWKPMLCQLL